MPHEVVDVTGDPAALLQDRLLGQFAPRGLELSRQLPLAEDRAADQPWKSDPQDPDSDGDIASNLDQVHHHRRGGRQQTERNRRDERPRPESDNEREDRDLEHQRLVPSAALGQDDWHNHRHGDRPKRHVRQTRPQPERRDRDRDHDQINNGRRVSQRTNYGHSKREDRNEESNLISLDPRPT